MHGHWLRFLPAPKHCTMADGFVRKDPFDVTPYKILKGVEVQEARRADALTVRQDAERSRDEALRELDEEQQAATLLKDQQAAVKVSLASQSVKVNPT